MLSPEELGWDPTMALYSEETENSCPSYTFFWSNYHEGHSVYDFQWVITFNDGTRYITIRALTIVGSEIMCGRATCVWEVVLYKDFQKGFRSEVSHTVFIVFDIVINPFSHSRFLF